MPRGRPKKTAAQVELLPPEENDQPKIREIKHKTEWIEAVPVEETPEGDDGLEEVEIEDRPRKRNKNAIQEMRKRLRAQGVTPSSNLRLYIERYVHSETDAGGSWAETEFCTKYQTTEEHIVSKDYIDAARKWGPGKYRITIRMDNRIVDAFDERISATPAGPVIQNVNPNDPNSPQVIFQSDGQQQYQPMSMKDMMKAQRESLKEELEFRRLLMESYGMAPNQQGFQQQPRTEEEIIASAIINQPAVIENVVSNLIKKVGGKAADDDAPWYADIVRKAVESGQAAQIVQVAIDRIFNGVSGLFPGRQQNGQAEMVQTPVQTVQSQGVNPGDGTTLLQQGSMGETNSQSGSTETQESAGVLQPQAITPEDQALQRLIDNCHRGVPVQVAFDQLINYADWLNDQAPQYSIDGYLSMFAAMPVEAALEFVKTQPNGEAVASLSHAKEWTEQLQRLIKEAGQEGEE